MPRDEVEDRWVDYAACTGQSTHLFYPSKHHKADRAKAICARCPVRQQCLDEAIARADHNGIWGGCSPEERKLISRARRREQQEEAA
jgi:WhiB family redox-sensing transcriptional regulator